MSNNPSHQTAHSSLLISQDSLFTHIRHTEFNRLDQHGHTYLDFTGGNLYPEKALLQHQNLLRSEILGNPHSTNPASLLSTTLVESARAKVLDFFRAEDYFCIFTQNATGALKIVGECYPFDQQSYFLALADNHNSVNGIREFCLHKGGRYEYCPIHYEDLGIDHEKLEELLAAQPDSTHKLFAFPAQSNVSGVKHDLKWIATAQDAGWDVLLDAAAFVPTSRLDLSVHKPDFVSISFYKIFGYPTGIGCLLVKKSKFEKLQKPWFAGGTVTLVSVATPNHYLANNHERFEDGTLNYLDIPAIKTGLEFIETIGIERITERVSQLINYLYEKLKHLTYPDGRPKVRIFGPEDRSRAGGTLIMNFYDPNGERIPFEEVEQRANALKISIRSGCFCNPGIDEVNNCITGPALSAYFSSRNKGDYKDMMAFLGIMRGATRVSVGIATNQKDLDNFIEFVERLQ
ncbi:MAG: aminotransferase class V-fold PLP-dependent enzyme [Saprospiraceae bacterium]|nr:aminotransferase class V-fold PLP-dependent enzyme [Saprospiraceae bacterium]